MREEDERTFLGGSEPPRVPPLNLSPETLPLRPPPRTPHPSPTCAPSAAPKLTHSSPEVPLKLVLWRAAIVWVSTRAPLESKLEVPTDFAPAGDSIAGAPAKERRGCKSAD
jgi:hypothetical protein